MLYPSRNTALKLLLLLPVLLAAQCRGGDEFLVEPIDYLPPPTEKGEDVVGCLINGRARVTRSASDARVFRGDRFLQISASFELDSGEQDISITLQTDSPIDAPERYDLTNEEHTVAFFNSGASLPDCHYEDQQASTGRVEITYFDWSERVIAGTFAFTIVSEDCDTVEVTDGRFDILL